jgi:hypothetical protein
MKRLDSSRSQGRGFMFDGSCPRALPPRSTPAFWAATIHVNMRTTERLLQSWREAAEDLRLAVEQLGDAIVVKDFGSPRGMLCRLRQAPAEVPELRDEAASRGMGWSELGESYLHYDRTLFIDTLNDWGWCGEGPPPPWYSGEPWTP